MRARRTEKYDRGRAGNAIFEMFRRRFLSTADRRRADKSRGKVIFARLFYREFRDFVFCVIRPEAIYSSVTFCTRVCIYIYLYIPSLYHFRHEPESMEWKRSVPSVRSQRSIVYSIIYTLAVLSTAENSVKK